MNLQRALVAMVVVLAPFRPAVCDAEPAPHEPTPIPFDIDYFTDEQKALIDSAIEADSSPYSVLSRPVFFQIVYTGNNADETRNTQRIDRKVDVLIYGLGEALDGRLVDYGWIESVETGRRVWEMTAEDATHAGGDARNRKTVTRMTLQPGRYRLRYRSNDSHAYDDWQGDPPERPTFYGVTVFNMTALPTIDARLQRAGVAPLRSTLHRSGASPGDPADAVDYSKIHTRVLYLQGMDAREAVGLLRSKVQVRQIASFADRDLVVVAGSLDRVDASEALLREAGALVSAASPHEPLPIATPAGSKPVSTVIRIADDRTQEAVLLLRSIYQIRQASEFPQDDSISVQTTEPVLQAGQAMLRELGLLAEPVEEIRYP